MHHASAFNGQLLSRSRDRKSDSKLDWLDRFLLFVRFCWTDPISRTIQVALERLEPEPVDVMAEGNVTVELNPTLVEDTFTSPQSSAASPYPYCSDFERDNTVPSADSSPAHPVYPPAAIAKRQTGIVRFYVRLNEEGKLTQSGIFGSVGADPDQSTLDAIRKWTYSPYIRCGNGVEVEEIESIRYFVRR